MCDEGSGMLNVTTAQLGEGGVGERDARGRVIWTPTIRLRRRRYRDHTALLEKWQ